MTHWMSVVSDGPEEGGEKKDSQDSNGLIMKMIYLKYSDSESHSGGLVT